jgi:anaerobic selenocysteine-containing dehydrogenase
VAVPIDRLYDLGTTLRPSEFLLKDRITRAMVILHPDEAARLGLTAGQPARVTLSGVDCTAQVVVDESVPEGVALVPRSTGLPIDRPAPVKVQPENRE